MLLRIESFARPHCPNAWQAVHDTVALVAWWQLTQDLIFIDRTGSMRL